MRIGAASRQARLYPTRSKAKRPPPFGPTDSIRLLLLLLLLLLAPPTHGSSLPRVPSYTPARISRDYKSSASAVAVPATGFTGRRSASHSQRTTAAIRQGESAVRHAMPTVDGDLDDTASSLSRMNGEDPAPSASSRAPHDDDIDDSASSEKVSRRYRRTLLPVPDRALRSTHAIFGTLMRSGHGGGAAPDSSSSDAIVSYQVYKLTPIVVGEEDDEEAISSNDASVDIIDAKDDGGDGGIALVEAVVQFGRAVDGHPGVVHGGILALVVDDVLGFAYPVADPSLDVAVTANLNMNYRLPVPSGSRVLVQAWLLERSNRKLVFSCRVVEEDDRDLDGQQGVRQVYCDATSVYVIPRSAAAAVAAPMRSTSNL
jgi:acyl-coenzyme A thioesterase PaaI-like protein